MWGKPKLMQIIPNTNENDRNQREFVLWWSRQSSVSTNRQRHLHKQGHINSVWFSIKLDSCSELHKNNLTLLYLLQNPILCDSKKQGCQYRTGGRTGLATGTIYFGYRCTVSGLPLFYIYIYICMYVCVCVYIYIIINIEVYHKTFPQFRTNYSWF